jgi:hypothetical protein
MRRKYQNPCAFFTAHFEYFFQEVQKHWERIEKQKSKVRKCDSQR